MRTALRKILILVFGVCFLFLVSLFIITTPAKAFPWDAQSQSTFTLGNLFESGVFGLSGVCLDPKGSVEVSTNKILECDQTIRSAGAIGVTTGALASLYNPPISSVYYLANLGEGLGLGPNTAYAQVGGSGAGIVAPVFKLWQVSRNLAYLVMIVVFVVVGFMIMFRQKLDPQTVIGVQQALPGLIVALILITFSYFIASLIVDFAFVGIQLVTQFFMQVPNNSLGTPAQLANFAQNANIFSLFGASAFNSQNLGTVFQGTSGQLYTMTGGQGTSSVITATIGGAIGAVVAGPLFPLGLLVGAGVGASAIPVIIPAIVCLVLLIALFIQMFKLLLALLTAYITILLMTFAGPFFILAGAIPGKSSAVSGWIKNLAANVLIFPAVFGAFLFAGVILGDTTSWQGSTTLPLFGGLDKNFIRVLIAYGILLGIAGIPAAVKGALGVKDQQNPIMQAAMGGVAAGWGVAQAGGKRAVSPILKERQALEQSYGAARNEGNAAKRAEILTRQNELARNWRNIGIRKPWTKP